MEYHSDLSSQYLSKSGVLQIKKYFSPHGKTVLFSVFLGPHSTSIRVHKQYVTKFPKLSETLPIIYWVNKYVYMTFK